MDRTDRLFLRYRERGDARALGRVFDATAPEILRVARYLVYQDADDVLQQTFLTAIERAERWDPGRPLVPWLLGIAANHARAMRRGRRPTADEGALQAAAGGERDPVDAAAAAELGAELAAAIGRMRAPYGEVLRLHLVAGLEVGEIAHALDRSPDTVRSQIRRGLERLRNALPASAAGVAIAPDAAAARVAEVRARVLAEATAHGARAGLALPWQAAAALALGLGAAWLVWPEAGPDASHGASAVAAADSTGEDRSAAEPATAVAAPASERRTVAAGVEAVQAFDGPAVRVVDRRGEPIPGVELCMVDVRMLENASRAADALAGALDQWRLDDPLSNRLSRADSLDGWFDREDLPIGGMVLRGISDSQGVWRTPRVEELASFALRVIRGRAADGRTAILPMLGPQLRVVAAGDALPFVDGDTTGTFDAVLREPAELRVRVVDVTGLPLPGVPVMLHAPPLAASVDSVLAATGTAGVARFPRMQDLEPFVAEGETIGIALDYPQLEPVEPLRVDPRALPSQPLELVVPDRARGSVVFRIVDGHGEPVVGLADVLATAYREWPPESADDEVGRFQLLALDGEACLPRVDVGVALHADVVTSDGRRASAGGAGPRRARETAEIVVEVPEPAAAAGLVARVPGAAGRAAVLVLSGARWRNEIGPIEVAPDGVLRVEDVEVGAGPIQVACLVEPHAGHAARLAEDRAWLLSEELDLGELELRDVAAFAAGRVVDAGGAPVLDARVSAEVVGPYEEVEVEPAWRVTTHAGGGGAAAATRLAATVPWSERPEVVRLQDRTWPWPADGRLDIEQVEIDEAGSEATLDPTLREQPFVHVVPRRDGWFDVYVIGDAEVVHLTAMSAEQHTESAGEYRRGELDVALVLAARAALRGRVELPDGIEPFALGYRVVVEREVAFEGGGGDAVAPGHFSITDLPAGEASLAVLVAGEPTPVATVDGLRLEAGATTRCRPIDLTHVRVFELDVRLPDGRPWWQDEQVEGEGYVRRGAGESRTREELSQGSATAVATVAERIDLEIEVAGYRLVELRNVDGDRHVMLQPGMPIRIEVADPSVDTIFLSREGHPPHQRVARGTSGAFAARVAAPGRYVVEGRRGRPRFIDVVESVDVQRFRID